MTVDQVKELIAQSQIRLAALRARADSSKAMFVACYLIGDQQGMSNTRLQGETLLHAEFDEITTQQMLLMQLIRML